MKVGNKSAFLFAIVFVVLVLLVAGATATKDHKLNTTDNITKAQEIATQQNKHVFVVFTSGSCGWCDKLEQDTLSDEKVIATLDEKYVTAIVDVEKQPEVAKTFNAVGTPIIVLMDSNGTEIERLNGYYGPEELLEYL